MAIREEVVIKINADTNQYEREVKGATKATDDLGDAIDNVEDKATLGTEAVGDLGMAAKQTGEAAVDSATGISGLGAAMSAIAGRVRTAITALSGFSKALIATGVGAAVVALGVIVAYWEDIVRFISITIWQAFSIRFPTDFRQPIRVLRSGCWRGYSGRKMRRFLVI